MIEENEELRGKTVKTCSLGAILLFALTASIIAARPAYAAVARPTIPNCTLDIIAGAVGGTTLHLTNNTIADFIQQGHLTEISGEANNTNLGGKFYMDQYKGVSILELVHTVCQLTQTSTIIINSTDNHPLTYNYSAIANGQINVYTNTSALKYAGGFWNTTGSQTQVAHSVGEVLTPIIAYYINTVNGGVDNGGPTSFAGWQIMSDGPLRNTVLGCANKHYIQRQQSNKYVVQIIVTSPGAIHVIPEFPAGIVLPVVISFIAVAAFSALRRRSGIPCARITDAKIQ